MFRAHFAAADRLVTMFVTRQGHNLHTDAVCLEETASTEVGIWTRSPLDQASTLASIGVKLRCDLRLVT